MRIGLAVCAYPPYQGGISNAAARHARLLADAGQEVEVLCPAHEHRVGTDVVDGIVVHRLRALVRHGTSAFVPSIARRAADYDVLYLHYPFYGGVEPAALAAIVRRRPYVVFFHMDVIWDGWRGRLLAVHRALVAPAILRRAERVFVSSLDYARHSSIARHRLANLEERPYGVDTDRYTPGPVDDAALARLGLDPARRRVLFVGAMDRGHAFKGVPELLRAFAALPGRERAQLVLVGDGELRTRYMGLARDLGLDGDVVFTGRVSEDDLIALNRAAWLSVLPSLTRDEAFGIVLIEAMACGAPVVATDLPGVRTVVRPEHGGGLIPPGDVPALTAAIAAALDDEPGREERSRRALEAARGRFSQDAERAALVSAFHDVAGRR